MRIWKVKEWKQNKGKQFVFSGITSVLRLGDFEEFDVGETVNTKEGLASIVAFNPDCIHVMVAYDYKDEIHIVRHTLDIFPIDDIKKV